MDNLLTNVFVGTDAELDQCRHLFSYAPNVTQVRTFKNLDLFFHAVSLQEINLNMAVVCGDYDSKTQTLIKKKVRWLTGSPTDNSINLVFYTSAKART